MFILALSWGRAWIFWADNICGTGRGPGRIKLPFYLLIFFLSSFSYVSALRRLMFVGAAMGTDAWPINLSDMQIIQGRENLNGENKSISRIGMKSVINDIHYFSIQVTQFFCFTNTKTILFLLTRCCRFSVFSWFCGFLFYFFFVKYLPE